MLTKAQIIRKMISEMPFAISQKVLPYLEEAMELYANQGKDELITWVERNVQEYDAMAEKQTGSIANYYLGKASGINEVKLFIKGLPIVSDNPLNQ